MSPFHRWLLRQRPYCEICTGPYPSTRIIDIDNKNLACCDAHARAIHPEVIDELQDVQDWK